MLDATITPAALKPEMVALLGLPLDEHSSFRRGTAAAPPRIRAALACESTNLSSEDGRDLGAELRLADLGDLDLAAGGDAAPAAITAAVAAVLDRRARVLALGGDHSVTLPVLRAYGPRFPGLTVVQLDAHPDLYDIYSGNRLSHACTFARMLEEGLRRGSSRWVCAPATPTSATRQSGSAWRLWICATGRTAPFPRCPDPST